MNDFNRKLILRNGSSTNMENKVLAKGEPFVEIDGSTTMKLKIGDGVTPYQNLEYVSSGASVSINQSSSSGSYYESDTNFYDENNIFDYDTFIDWIKNKIPNPTVGASYVCVKSNGKHIWRYYVEKYSTTDNELKRIWSDKPQYQIDNVFYDGTTFENYINSVSGEQENVQSSILNNKIVAVKRDDTWDLAIIDITENPKYVWYSKTSTVIIDNKIENVAKYLIASNMLDNIYDNLNGRYNISYSIPKPGINDNLSNKLSEIIDDPNTINDLLIYKYKQVSITMDNYENDKYYIFNESKMKFELSTSYSDDIIYYEVSNDEYITDFNIATSDFPGYNKDTLSLLVYMKTIFEKIIKTFSNNDTVLANDIYKKYIIIMNILSNYSEILSNYCNTLDNLSSTVEETFSGINESLDKILNGKFVYKE